MTRLTVRRGSTGSIVVELQRKLKMLGYYHGEQHGRFDADTEKAVIALQRAEGLNADGNVCIKTWSALNNKRTRPHASPPPPPATRRGPINPIKGLPKPPSPIPYPPKKPFAQKPGYAPIPKHPGSHKAAASIDNSGTVAEALANLPELPVETSYTPKDIPQSDSAVAVLSSQRVDVLEAVDITDNKTVETLAESPDLSVESSATLKDSGTQPDAVAILNPTRVDAREAGDITDGKVVDTIAESFELPPASPSKPAIRPALQPGDSGITVQTLQMMLHLLDYYDGPVNSVFDEATTQAVTSFQNGNGLVPNGMVDSKTWEQLDNAMLNISPSQPLGLLTETRPSLLPGDSGEPVKVLQMMLHILGHYNDSINSVFDEATKQAVTDFQKSNGVTPSYIVGSTTWEALNHAIIKHVPALSLPSSSAAVPVLSPTLSPPPAASASAEPSSPVSVPVSASKPANKATVRLGDSGTDVEHLKKALAGLGYYTGPVNQTFDALLNIAVVCFQRDHGLVPDGIAGPLTWAAIDAELDSPPSQHQRSTLRAGDVSKAVVYLQGTLRLLGYYNGPVTKRFTPATQAAVQNFQRDRSLVVDGIVGPITWAALDEATAQFNEKHPVIKLGNTGYAVARLQRLLTDIGLYCAPIDSIYSEKLESSVRAFQSNQGLVSDGVTGPKTWQALEAWQALHARDNISLCWAQNPNDLAIATDAFNVVSPVWYDLAEIEGSLDINPRRASAEFTKAAHKRGISVWGTIQSFNASLTRRLVTDEAEISKFIDKMKKFSAAHQLDGLCIDFEYMYVEDKDRFTEFVHRVSGALKSDASARNKQFVISVCFTAPPSPDGQNNMWSACVDRTALGLICDYCCLMLYDELGPGSDKGPIASQSWATESLRRTLEEVSQKVLLLGVPFYSAKWSSQTGENAMYLTMDMVQSLLDNGYFSDRSGNTIKVSRYTLHPVYQDGELLAEFIDTRGTTHKICAHTPQSVAERLALVPEHNLTGAAFWELFYSNSAVWDVVRKQLRNL